MLPFSSFLLFLNKYIIVKFICFLFEKFSFLHSFAAFSKVHGKQYETLRSGSWNCASQGNKKQDKKLSIS